MDNRLSGRPPARAAKIAAVRDVGVWDTNLLRCIATGALASALMACGSDANTPADNCEDGDNCETSDGTAGGSGDSGDATGSGEDGAQAGDIPCEVQEVLAANCTGCHSDPVKFGATMPLASIEHFRVPAVTDPTVSVADLTLARMVDTDRPMPADSSLSDGDRGIIEAWIAAGMPGEDAGECEGVADDGDDPWGPDTLPCEPDQLFLAHNNGTDEGFNVPEVSDLYQCFAFDSPFTDKTQGIAWAPVIDDERVVHHWLLLRGDETTQTGTFPCSAISLDAPMIMGWAPGTPNFIMPDEAGLELPGPGEKIILQIHYNNSAGHTDAIDSSGVAMCTTEEPREHAAGTLWLGSLQIDVPAGGTQDVVSDCDTSRLDEPVHMLLSWPHMHELGSAISTELIRANGAGSEMLADVPAWNFYNQVYYPHLPAVVIEPGDILRTTCSYDNTTGQTVNFGEGTGDEMCFDFSIVYPITAFDVPNPFGPAELGRYCVDFGEDIPFP